MDEAGGEVARGARAGRYLRLGALVVVLAALFIVGRTTGLGAYFTREGIQSTVASAGPFGYVAYVALFTVGALIQLPGWLFVAAGCVSFGRLFGGLAAYVGSVVAVTVTFVVVRSIGGSPLGEVRRPWVKRALARPEARPITTVAIIRTFVGVAPYMNYALALSPVRLRDYVIGSVIGLVPPTCVMTIAIDWLLR